MVNLGRLLDLHRQWKATLPTVEPFYAVKCNEDPALLQTLAALGTGFDCASKVSRRTVGISLSHSCVSLMDHGPFTVMM